MPSPHEVGFVSLVKINPAKNQRRFYLLEASRDLFGQPVLIRQYGRIGRTSRVKVESFLELDQAEQKLRKLAASKIRRGYAVNEA